MPKAEKFTPRDLERKQKRNRWRASNWLVEGQDAAGWGRKINNLHRLNIHFQWHRFLLHCVSGELRRNKCVIFIYKALLGFQKKSELNFMEKRRGKKNSCKRAVFSQDKWGGLSPAWKLPFWKLSSYGCLSGDNTCTWWVYGHERRSKFQRTIQTLVFIVVAIIIIIIHSAAHTHTKLEILPNVNEMPTRDVSLGGFQGGVTHRGQGIQAEWHTVGPLLQGFIYADLRVKDLEKMQTSGWERGQHFSTRPRACGSNCTRNHSWSWGALPHLSHTSSLSANIRHTWPGLQSPKPAETQRKTRSKVEWRGLDPAPSIFPETMILSGNLSFSHLWFYLSLEIHFSTLRWQQDEGHDTWLLSLSEGETGGNGGSGVLWGVYIPVGSSAPAGLAPHRKVSLG